MIDEKENFEQLLSTLERAVQLLESGDLPLNESLLTLEDGMRCYRQCRQILTAAENKAAELVIVGDEEDES